MLTIASLILGPALIGSGFFKGSFSVDPVFCHGVVGLGKSSWIFDRKESKLYMPTTQGTLVYSGCPKIEKLIPLIYLGHFGLIRDFGGVKLGANEVIIGGKVLTSIITVDGGKLAKSFVFKLVSNNKPALQRFEFEIRYENSRTRAAIQPHKLKQVKSRRFPTPGELADSIEVRSSLVPGSYLVSISWE